MPSKYKGTDAEIRALTTFISLSRAAAVLGDRVTAHLRSHGLTGSQFGVLDALYHLGPLKQHELSEKLLLSPGNITTVLKNMEISELITRQAPEDSKRCLVVSLTEGGRDLFEAILPEHVAGVVKETGALTSEEQMTLIELAKKLGSSCRGKDLGI